MSVSFVIQGRAGFGNNPIDVKLDGQDLGTYSPQSTTSFNLVVTPNVIVTAGSHVLSFIGTNPIGDADSFVDNVKVVYRLGNLSNGVLISNASGNTVGGATSAAHNIISSNHGQGVNIQGAGSTGNLVTGNYVGTDVAGTSPLPNSNSGILVGGSAMLNTIGGLTSTPGQVPGNVASGNALGGIAFQGVGTSLNVAIGNVAGLKADDSGTLPNGAGIAYVDGASGNTIGGNVARARNVISGNLAEGVLIEPFNTNVGPTNNLVVGNYIGVDLDGVTPRGNVGPGVVIDGGTGGNASGNTIGGTVAGAGNVISGNAQDGVLLNVLSTSTLVEGNIVGLAADGSTVVPNGHDGIFVWGSTSTIGGTVAGAGNVVSGNNAHQVELAGAGATGDLVAGNLIGTNAAGTQARTDPAAQPWADGIIVDVFASHDTIGGTTAAARNVISGNGSNGIDYIDRQRPTGNLVEGNYIGTDASRAPSPWATAADGMLVTGSPTTRSAATATPGTGPAT